MELLASLEIVLESGMRSQLWKKYSSQAFPEKDNYNFIICYKTDTSNYKNF